MKTIKQNLVNISYRCCYNCRSFTISLDKPDHYSCKRKCTIKNGFRYFKLDPIFDGEIPELKSIQHIETPKEFKIRQKIINQHLKGVKK